MFLVKFMVKCPTIRTVENVKYDILLSPCTIFAHSGFFILVKQSLTNLNLCFVIFPLPLEYLSKPQFAAV